MLKRGKNAVFKIYSISSDFNFYSISSNFNFLVRT